MIPPTRQRSVFFVLFQKLTYLPLNDARPSARETQVYLYRRGDSWHLRRVTARCCKKAHLPRICALLCSIKRRSVRTFCVFWSFFSERWQSTLLLLCTGEEWLCVMDVDELKQILRQWSICTWGNLFSSIGTIFSQLFVFLFSFGSLLLRTCVLMCSWSK